MIRSNGRFAVLAAILAATTLALGAPQDKKPEPATPAMKVSYDRQIRPIFQAQCMGCHQPAKAKGSYIMTTREKMLVAGEAKLVNVAPGHPEKSNLVDQITPKNGEAEMPKGRKPLAPADIELVKRWIAEGAVDDTPANAKVKFDVDHPPVYTRPPVIPSIDFSPDGQLLAVAGFH